MVVIQCIDGLDLVLTILDHERRLDEGRPHRRSSGPSGASPHIPSGHPSGQLPPHCRLTALPSGEEWQLETVHPPELLAGLRGEAGGSTAAGICNRMILRAVVDCSFARAARGTMPRK